jgi:hypothetical protein
MLKEFGEFLNAHSPNDTLVGAVALLLFIVCGITVFVLFLVGLAKLAIATHWGVVPLICRSRLRIPKAISTPTNCKSTSALTKTPV